MTTKEELIERLVAYDKAINERIKNMNQFTICTNAEIEKLFRQKLEENNYSLK